MSLPLLEGFIKFKILLLLSVFSLVSNYKNSDIQTNTLAIHTFKYEGVSKCFRIESITK